MSETEAPEPYELPPSEVTAEEESQFQMLVDQEEDYVGFSGPWGETPEDKDLTLQQAGNFVVQFLLARLVRYSRIGNPQNLKVMLQVEIDGQPRLFTP